MRKLLEKINILNLSLILVLFGLTLFRISILTNEMSSIDIMKKRIAELSKENQKLEDEFLATNSISNLSQFLENSNLVKAEKIKFIQILEGGMVVVK
jgi:cell division protein FtsB